MNKKSKKKKALDFVVGGWKAYREIDGFLKERNRFNYELQRRNHEARARRKAIDYQLQLRLQEIDQRVAQPRFASFNDLLEAGLVRNPPRRVYLGVHSGELLFYNGDSHLLTYGRTGSGKGTCVIAQNLAHIKHSIYVIDPKGENYLYSHQHRSINLEQEILPINPWGLHNAPSVDLNPLDSHKAFINDIPRLLDKVMGSTMLIVVKPVKAGSNEWVYIEARQLLEALMLYTVTQEPDNYDLSHLWKLANATSNQLKAIFEKMKQSSIEYLRIRGAKLLDMINLEDNAKQFDIISNTVATALNPYKPGSVLGEATKKTTIDPAILKKKPTTLYLMVPPEHLRSNASWIALVTDYMINRIALTQGKVRTTFFLDEFANLPRMEVILKALRLYRGFNIQLWFFLQGRHSLEPTYTAAERKEIEDQAGVMQMWDVEDISLASDIEKMAGYIDVQTVSTSYSAGTVQSGGMSSGTQKRPLLPVDMLRRLGNNKQILRVPGCRLILAERYPWWEFDVWRRVLVDPGMYSK